MKWFVQSISKKINSLVATSFISFVILIGISVIFFGKINQISTLLEAGHTVRSKVFSLIIHYERYISTGNQLEFEKFEEDAVFIAQKSGAIVKLHKFLNEEGNVEAAVKTYGKETSDYDSKAAFATAKLLKALKGNSLRQQTVDTSEKAYASTTMVLELGRSLKNSENPETKEKLQKKIKTVFPEMERLTLQILNDFREISKHLFKLTRSIFFFLAAILIIPQIILSFYIIRSITIPLKQTVHFAENIAQGDFTTNLEIKNIDELGIMAKTLTQMKTSLSQMISNITMGINTLSSSSTELFSISEQMSNLADNAKSKTIHVEDSAMTMSSNMDSVADLMVQSAHNINMVTTSSKEMASTIDEIAQNVKKGRGVSEMAVKQANSASEKMSELGNAAQKIGKVTETITEISEQTNLLALNATIEAARAGEAGKGFAVVANEIKELARQTASATQDIKGQIEDIQATTQNTVTEINQVTQIINTINGIVSIIASAVEEQSSVTIEINRNIDQVSKGISDASRNVSENATVSSSISKEISEVSTYSSEIVDNSLNVSSSAESLSHLSEQLGQLVSRFRMS